MQTPLTRVLNATYWDITRQSGSHADTATLQVIRSAVPIASGSTIATERAMAVIPHTSPVSK